MAVLLILLGAVLPLLMAPTLLFHYDATPKTLLLFVVLLAALSRINRIPAEIGALRSRAGGRALTILALATVAWFGASAALSSRIALSVLGSGWREFGVATMAALCFAAVLVTAHLCNRPDRMVLLLRASAVAGLAVSAYGIAQYFDLDPFQSVQAYHALDGDSVIVRPPGTFGHADYFGWWLAIDFFCALAASKTESRFWQTLGLVSAALIGLAAVLTGTRSALLAIAAGSLALIPMTGFQLRPRSVLTAGIAAGLFALFLFSPPGERVRSRIAWSGHEPAGGARPLLWRDALRMGVAKPITGFGPETFSSSFGPWESDELSRLYPDFHHESPHNVALDALTEAGVPGFLLVLGWAYLAFRVALRARRSQSKTAPLLAAGVLASAVAALFSAAVMPALLLTMLLLGMLIASEKPDRDPAPLRSSSVWAFATPVFAGATVFVCLLTVSDYRLARFQRNPGVAAYNFLTSVPVPLVSEDIYCSRVLASACGAADAGASQYDCWRTAVRAAARATGTADDTANAWYNLAQFTAAQNDVGGTRMALSHAIQSSPKWFKPHWAMAELAARTGDRANARLEAERAEALDAKRDPELLASLANLKARLN